MALTSGGSMVQDIIDKTNRMEAAKNDVQKQLDDVNKRVKGEEDLINSINQAGIKVTSDANRLREEIKNLECDCEKAEEDKSTKDNQIRNLREEIALPTYHIYTMIFGLYRQLFFGIHLVSVA